MWPKDNCKPVMIASFVLAKVGPLVFIVNTACTPVGLLSLKGKLLPSQCYSHGSLSQQGGAKGEVVGATSLTSF